jgi:outer membrane autotransporter protein
LFWFIRNTYAGIYSVYQAEPDRPRSWYSSAAVLYGRMNINNTVPGELGYGLSQRYGGNILAASLENGLTFRRPNGWFVEPQLQLLYTKVLQRDFFDNLGATVAVRRGDSLAARLGVMALRSVAAGDGRQIKYWARAGYQRELCADSRVEVAGDEAVSGGGRNVFQLSAGVSVNIDKQLSLSGDISRSFGDEHGYRGSISLKGFW